MTGLLAMSYKSVARQLGIDPRAARKVMDRMGIEPIDESGMLTRSNVKRLYEACCQDIGQRLNRKHDRQHRKTTNTGRN